MVCAYLPQCLPVVCLLAYNLLNNLSMRKADGVSDIFYIGSIFYLMCALRDREMFPPVTLQLAPMPPTNHSHHLCQAPKRNEHLPKPHTHKAHSPSFHFHLGLAQGPSSMHTRGNAPSNCAQVAGFSTSKAMSHNGTLAEVMFAQWHSTGWHNVTNCHRGGLPHPGPRLLERVNKWASDT